MIVRMAKVRILGPRSLLPAVVGLLQDAGYLHIESKPQDLPGIQSEIPVIRPHVLDPDSQRTRDTLEAALEKTKKLLLVLPVAAGTRGPESVENLARDEAALRDASALLDSLADRAGALAGERKALEGELSLLSRYDKVLKALGPLISVVRESRDLACTGLVLQARDRDVAGLLEKSISGLTGGRHEIFYREVDRETLAGLLVFPAADAAEIRALLWEKNIGELRLPSSVADKPIGEALEILIRRQAEIPRRIRDLDAELASLSLRWRRGLEASRLRLENRIGGIHASDSFFETRHTFLLYGWIPRGKLSKLIESFAAAHGDTIVVERLPVGKSEEERIPVAISNPALVRPFEIFTRILPLPRYGTIDPTPFVAIFFPLFYGIIIGDIGYGLLLLAIASLAKSRYRSNPFIADAATVFSWAAISAIVWGFAYGELFGDLGSRLGLRPVFLHRMGDYRETILFALAIGVVHVLLGIALGIRTAWKRADRREAASRAAGFVLMIGFLAAAAGILGKVPRTVTFIGLAGVAVCLPAMILSAGASSVMKLHNLVNMVSYLRIMGIGVASAALACTANRFVTLIPWPALGILAAVALHAINLAFCILSPTIQALRLHYVEFFENFFSGGGRPYKPFKNVA